MRRTDQHNAHDLFWRLLEPEHRRAEAFCRRLARGSDDGDDLYQEGLLTALRKFDSLRDPGSFRPWLYRILVNTYRNRNRTPWWRRRVSLTGHAIEPSAGPDPAEAHAARRWLQRGLAVLSAEDRALVCLYELEGWSVADLAAMAGRPEGTIKARLARSREKMRRAIERCLTQPEHPVTDGAAYALPGSERPPE
ncbi:MAG: RNA polymerase sigma factor [candidate division Zixibacteria bacterium]|jgi:RNA polymerase sigma-70 factor (ECF subfamily)|nr:RNA polymerase sigma factor [candidate division Zixibacteria bacterium]